MSLRSRLKDLFGSFKSRPEIIVAREPEQIPAPTEQSQHTAPTGRIVKANRDIPYRPDAKRQGGRMVRTMPRSLRKMKEHAEDDGV